MTLFVTRRSQIPGSRFNPTNQELIRILRRKIERGKGHSFITDMHVYEKEPWLLQHVRHFRSVKNEWYYFVSRTKPPGIKKEDSKKTSRTVAGFRWKSNTKKTLIEDKNGVMMGYIQSLTFLVKGKASGWVMHEFLLDKSGFQEVVLCRIRFNPDNGDAHEYAPRLGSIVIGQPQPPREEAAEDKIHQGVEQQQQLWTGSSPSEVFSYPSGQYQQFMNGGMDQYRGFGCYGRFVGAQPYYQDMARLIQNMMENLDFGSYAQYLGGDLAQNHLPLTRQGMEPEQQDNSCFDHNVFENIAAQQQQQQQQWRQDSTNFSETQQGMMVPDTQIEFGSSTQFSGGDLTQNHHSVVPMETQKGIEPQQYDNSCFGHNVVENQTTEPPHLTQEQNQPLGELDEMAEFGNWAPELGDMTNVGDEELAKLLGELDETADFENWEWTPELEDMANFGNEEWAKKLGENTPEEEAELEAELGNCKTTASLVNYFCPI